jgi:molybdate transport system regulatory protein
MRRFALFFKIHNESGLDGNRRFGHAVGVAKLSIRIDFESPGAVLGPGRAELLERIGKMGSIRQAAAPMDMSCRKAWLLIQALQESFGGDVLTTVTGGAARGGAALTERGRYLLATYRRINDRATKAVQADLAALTALVKIDAEPKDYAKGKGVQAKSETKPG